MASPVAALLDARVRADAAGPLITYYDDATGERTELSAATLANWVAKTANLLQDGLDLEPGHRIAVLLPPHWQTAAVLLGAWAVGATVTTSGEPSAADEEPLDDEPLATPAGPVDLVATTEIRAFEFADDGRPILATALHPLGGRLGAAGTPPAGVTDLADALLYGDDFVPWEPVDPEGAALEAGSLRLSATALAASAYELGARMGLADGDRLLVDADLAEQAGPVAWLLAPLAAGASIVLCAHPDPAGIERRAAAEKVTVTLGLHVPGLRVAGG